LQGKFSQRNTLGNNTIIREPADFYRLVYDHRVEISHITRITDEAIRVHTVPKVDFIRENPSSNIVIRLKFSVKFCIHFSSSLWTTSQARLVLLNYMQTVQMDPRSKLLYTGGI
jgi:hypothetical protein